ncbi:MAG TPA: tRNA (guanosine(37)-N1)-methyltransferase TrmD, partial [Acholeplasmataceae bacterium]|nr:tRNA (guanosine(37)-N1)-methyltransferase TrmD [Acholeplasmataceae bacterium]
NNLLEYPQYTRPEEFEGYKVPSILLSGNHENIRKYRRFESLKRTYQLRPDLLEKASLTKEDLKFLELIKQGKELDL